MGKGGRGTSGRTYLDETLGRVRRAEGKEIRDVEVEKGGRWE